jgi:rare lipoprotein A
VLLLPACSTDSRYEQREDSAPQVSLDPATIQDAVPRPEVIRQAGNRSPYRVLGKTYRVMSQEDARSYRTRGEASWYGAKFHGHQTSNGEIYDMYAMTAAHKSLPIPCYVRVVNLDNGRSTVVRVNDRGPFHGGRVIDLSFAAATKLGYAQRGVANVEIAVIDAAASPAAAPEAAGSDPAVPRRYLQAAAFSKRAKAEALRQRLARLLRQPVAIAFGGEDQPAPYRVRIGPLLAAEDELQIRELMMAENLGQPYPVVD